jgi:glucose repression mediator protein
LKESPNHAKVLQQLGWLYNQANTSFTNHETAVNMITRSLDVDATDATSWYLLGRCYMSQQKFNKAYESYQQAVYRDGRNPIFWCSIGVLYYQINQYRDALDAYSRAIRLNPFISEVWLVHLFT